MTTHATFLLGVGSNYHWLQNTTNPMRKTPIYEHATLIGVIIVMG